MGLRWQGERIRAMLTRVNCNHTVNMFKETNKNSQKWVSIYRKVAGRKLGQTSSPAWRDRSYVL